MSEFESSVVSQAVRLSGRPSLVIAEMPANGGLLRIGRRSPRSGISHFWPGTADSLRPIFEIFPFLGDRDRRPGSICTAWSLWQSSSRTSQLISHKIRVTQNIAALQAVEEDIRQKISFALPSSAPAPKVVAVPQRLMPGIPLPTAGRPAHATPRLRVRAGQPGPRYPRPSSLSRPREYSAHGPLHRAGARSL
jgi:hypothetical protein